MSITNTTYGVETTRWSVVVLTDGHREVDGDSERGIALLREYRRSGSIVGWWPCSLDELNACDDDDVADAGVAVSAIDWTGFPFAVSA